MNVLKRIVMHLKSMKKMIIGGKENRKRQQKKLIKYLGRMYNGRS